MSKENRGWFRKRMLDYFKKAGREHLPWRRPGIGAYEVWVSEIMLQQTQVSRVIHYYERFLKKFPTIDALARTTWKEFLPYYRGLGYYARGRNMLRTAKVIAQQYDGKFPRTEEELQRLPGIGPYTARAIGSFAYRDPLLAWDTNVRRVMGRFFFGAKELVNAKEEALLDARFGWDAPWMNAALMDFGSSLCRAQPKCAACMLRARCIFVRTRGRAELSRKKARQTALQPTGALIYLHDRHHEYYSSNQLTYRPFRISRGNFKRADIKQYFWERYGLELSVRPPHGQCVFLGEQVVLVNAQILLGRPRFAVFAKAAVLEYNKNKLISS